MRARNDIGKWTSEAETAAGLRSVGGLSEQGLPNTATHVAFRLGRSGSAAWESLLSDGKVLRFAISQPLDHL